MCSTSALAITSFCCGVRKTHSLRSAGRDTGLIVTSGSRPVRHLGHRGGGRGADEPMIASTRSSVTRRRAFGGHGGIGGVVQHDQPDLLAADLGRAAGQKAFFSGCRQAAGPVAESDADGDVGERSGA